MSVLVTGGNGFIGSQIVRLLCERGDGPVHVTHRSPDVSRLASVASQVHLHRLDLADLDAVSATMRTVRPRVIYHFGAMLSGPGEADPTGLLQTNVVGVIRLFDEALLAGTEQVLFASSLGTYGRDLGQGPITDLSLQRPNLIYGVSKLFGETLGGWYRAKHGLDVRGVRYPSIVGPGVSTWSLAQYTSWMIERPALGEAFTAWVPPETAIPILYFKDAARAAVELAAAAPSDTTTAYYLVDGAGPTPSAGQLAEAVTSAIPGARIAFEPDRNVLPFLTHVRPIDDTAARTEWGWTPEYHLDSMVDDFLHEVQAR